MWLAQHRGPLTAGLRCLTALPTRCLPQWGGPASASSSPNCPGCFSLISQIQGQLPAGGKGRSGGGGPRQVLEEAPQGHRKGFSRRESREELGGSQPRAGVGTREARREAQAESPRLRTAKFLVYSGLRS